MFGIIDLLNDFGKVNWNEFTRVNTPEDEILVNSRKNLHGALGVDTARWVTSPATFPSTKEYAITNCLVALVTEFQFALKTPFEFRRVSKPFTIV